MDGSGRYLRVPFTLALDVLLLLSLGALVWLATAGGGVVSIRSAHVSIRSAHNPALLFGLLAALRSWTAPYQGMFWLAGLSPYQVFRLVGATVQRLPVESFRSWRRGLAYILILSVALRLINALAHPGFVTGDDVELHEMTLKQLFNADWPI